MDVAISGPMPKGTISDESGGYRLSVPPFTGRTRLSAAKPSSGYPDTQGLLFASGKENMPLVHLLPGASLEGINIILGPPDGTLTGRVVDKITGTSVPNARITLHRSDPESVYSSSLPFDGSFSFALPQAPIGLLITAPGYLSWKYRDDKTGRAAVVLSGSDHLRITVELSRP
jgi:hypothetical protein